MQAVSIYILIRLDEGPTEENDFDSLLLAVVIVRSTACGSVGQLSDKTSLQAISKQLKCYDRIRKSQVTSRAYSLHQQWEDWVFQESSTRSVFGLRLEFNSH